MSIRLSGIVMQYPGTRALDAVSVDFRFDEVHGLIGENGAGKTTLVSILGGVRQPTAGQILIDGMPITLASAGDALRKGIAHVSQEGSLVPALSAAQNILLGDEPRSAPGVINRRALTQRAAALMARWFPEVSIDLNAPVQRLPMADQKVIEIVRALRSDIRLLILDEPTATLPAREKASLWTIIRSLPARGVGIILISHFLSEVKALSDRITVLRDGRHVATRPAADTTQAQLIDDMLQRTGVSSSTPTAAIENLHAVDPANMAEAGKRRTDTTVFELSGWQVGPVRVDHFSIQAGEIVGLIGLTGAGHVDFARSIYTGEAVSANRVRLKDKTLTRINARLMQRSGVAFIPDQRMKNALIADWDVRENLAMVHPEHAATNVLGVLSPAREKRAATAVMRQLRVKAYSCTQLVKQLSGGNKQKVAIGKWLYGAQAPYTLMIFIEPTEGVDIGAKRDIHAHLRGLAAQGSAILVASSDLLEIAEIADRVIAFVNGQPGDEIARSDFSESRFIAAMAGVRP